VACAVDADWDRGAGGGMARLASIAIVSEAAHSSDAPEAAARPMDWNIFSMLALVATRVIEVNFQSP
jgi:hypothetical protein